MHNLVRLECMVRGGAIHEQVADKCTLIYAVKAGGTAPTAAEAIEFWKTGFNKLGSVRIPTNTGEVQTAGCWEISRIPDPPTQARKEFLGGCVDEE